MKASLFKCLTGLGLIGFNCFGALSAETTTPAPSPRPLDARVVIVTKPGAMETYVPQPGKIKIMVDQGIVRLTGKTTPSQAWLSLVSTQDIVGIKVFCSPGPTSGTRVAVVAGIVEGLLAAGLPPRQIIVWDRQDVELQLAGYYELTNRYGIRVASSLLAGYDEKQFYDSSLLGNLVFGDLEFGKKGDGIGRKSYLSKLVTQEMTKIINVPPLLNHNEAGVTGCLFSLAIGSVDNVIRFESPERLAQAVPEIYALPVLSDRVVVNIVDALICQYEGEQRSLLHYSTVLNQLRFSKDPVALDVLSQQELDRQRELTKALKRTTKPDLVENAGLLELGIADKHRIHVESLP